MKQSPRYCHSGNVIHVLRSLWRKLKFCSCISLAAFVFWGFFCSLSEPGELRLTNIKIHLQRARKTVETILWVLRSLGVVIIKGVNRLKIFEDRSKVRRGKKLKWERSGLKLFLHAVRLTKSISVDNYGWLESLFPMYSNQVWFLFLLNKVMFRLEGVVQYDRKPVLFLAAPSLESSFFERTTLQRLPFL